MNISEITQKVKTIADTLKKQFIDFPVDVKKVPVILSLAVALSIGIVSGIVVQKANSVKPDDYNAVKRELAQTNTALQTACSERDSIQNSYVAYTAKMQPYEAQQQADAERAAAEKAAAEKAAAEKAAAEQAAAEKAAAEKAAAEKAAAEKAAAEQAAAAKAYSFGFTPDEFYTKFNSVSAANGFRSAFTKSINNGNLVDYLTMNSDVTANVSLTNGYVSSIFITAMRTTPESLTDSANYLKTAAMVIDSSLTAKSANTLMNKVLNGAKANLGSDYKVTQNGINYTMNIDNSSILIMYSK